MKIPDHVLKKYAQDFAHTFFYRILERGVPWEYRYVIDEASDNDAEFDENYDRLIELLETAHVGLSWTKEN